MSDRLEDLLESAKTVRQSTDVLLLAYKNGATARKYAFEITDEEADALFRSPCHYCGYHPPHRFNGIDRVVNGVGYVSGNVVACCSWCNRAKGRYAAAEFLKWLVWVKSGATAAPQESAAPEVPIQWPAPAIPPTERAVYIPSGAETRIALGGLTPKEYVRRKIWQEPISEPKPIPAPVVEVPSAPVKTTLKLVVPRKPKLVRVPKPVRVLKPVRILRAHDFNDFDLRSRRLSK